jgi:hypothetical protein
VLSVLDSLFFLQRHSSSLSSALAASGVSCEAWPRSRSLVSPSASVRHPRSAGQKPSPLLCSVCDSPIGLLEFSRCSIFLLISSLAAIICSRFVLLVFPPFSDVLDLGVSPFRFSNVCSEEVPPSIVGGAVDF